METINLLFALSSVTPGTARPDWGLEGVIPVRRVFQIRKTLRIALILLLLKSGAWTSAFAATPGTYEADGIRIVVGSTGRITSVNMGGSDSWMFVGHTFTGDEIKGDGVDEAWGSWDDTVRAGTDYTIRHCDFTAIFDGDSAFTGSFRWNYKQKVGSDIYQGSGGNIDYTAPGTFEFNLGFIDSSHRVLPASDTIIEIHIITDNTNNANVTLGVSDPEWMHVSPINWSDNSFRLSADANSGGRREGTVTLGYNGYSRTLKVIQSAANSPEIAIELQDGTILSDNIGTLDFGDIAVGSSSVPVVLTVRNLGTADLTGIEILKSGSHATVPR